ncbi:MAG: hypothetical protein ABIJ41_04980 [Candidatus Omnitrophota bacterium]
MIVLVKLLGGLVIVVGLTIFASPAFTKKIFAFVQHGKNIYYAGVARCVLGIILFICASRSSVPLAAIALGLMFVMSGIVVFAADLRKLKALIASYSEMPALVIRLLGLMAASFGMLVFSIF